MAKNYPAFAERLKLKPAVALSDTSRFEFDLQVRKLQNLVNFFEERLQGFDESTVKGSYDGYKNKAYLEVEVPAWEYENIKFKDVYLRSKLNGPEGSLQVGVIETAFSETQKLSPISLIGTVYSDTLEFLIISSNFYKILDNININGMLTLEENNAMRISFKPSDLVVLNDTWAISTDNYLKISDKSVETSNFILSSGQRTIELSSIRGEGLELQLSNYPIDSLAFIKDIKKHKIGGTADLTARVKNVFKFEGLSTLLRINDLTINGDNYGVLQLDASGNSIKETVKAALSIEGDSSKLIADGYFNPPGFVAADGQKWIKSEPLYFDFDVDIEKYPVKIVNYFVPEVLNPKGSITATDVKFSGLPSKPDISGLAQVNGVEFGIKPIGVTYRVPTGQVTINNRIFDARGTWVYDRENNKAMLDGGITHNHLKNFGLDLTISTEKNKPFIGMETTERDNPVFYGRAIGSGYVRFTQTFQKPELEVVATTKEGTYLYLPMKDEVGKDDTSFIFFPQPTIETKTATGKQTDPQELRGLNMHFDVDITPEAVMEVVFDRTWGDVLKGTGSGNLKVDLTREGDFKINGGFEVATGQYLFTLMNVGLNKSFSVDKGGQIFWSGDPYDATIKINATYSGLSTSVYSLISEYLALASEDVQEIARSSTPVHLTMGLSGKLLKPDIQFNISFPGIPSEVRSYVENKMLTVRRDANELNRQVFGLLMLGQFLPSGYAIQAGDIGINTLSEMLSNQASIYLTEFFSEFLTGKNLVQGIDLDISFKRFTTSSSNLGNSVSSFTNNEFRSKLTVIVNDRFSVQAGTRVGSQTYYGTSGFWAGEFTLEYVLTKDRRLKLRMYANTATDPAFGKRNKQGLALSYKREFDSFVELFEQTKQKRQKRKLLKSN
ncbi:MAG: translocation/assembly module TamB domain-containing protein [Saprospiraceae bacterium]|nr:translocation/assembly module TamB domain-containing protein [Saprospiraceae bacterium]